MFFEFLNIRISILYDFFLIFFKKTVSPFDGLGNYQVKDHLKRGHKKVETNLKNI